MTRARRRGEVERGRGSRWRSELGYACDGRGVGLAVAAVAAEVTWKWCRELRERGREGSGRRRLIFPRATWRAFWQGQTWACFEPYSSYVDHLAFLRN